MRLRRVIALACPLVVATALVVAAPASAQIDPGYQMPFPCKDVWTGSTYSGHSPSTWSIDFNKTGDDGAPMVAAAPGVVTTVADLGSRSYGRYIVVDHGNGYSTLYAHLKAQFVTLGQTVDEGSTMGLVGESGGVTGPHLHFEERHNGSAQRPYFDGDAFVMGSTQASNNCVDVPVAGVWSSGDGAGVGVFRRGRHGGKFRLRIPGQDPTVIRLGASNDVPVTGDWDGDGVTDVGVRRQGAREFLLRTADGSTKTIRFGRTVGMPVTGDWNGNGTTEVGLWNPSTKLFSLRSAKGKVRTERLGVAGSLPLTGDWNADGVTDLGVYDQRTSTFTLRTTTAGGTTTRTVDFGRAGDLPVTGDWNGDGRTDVGAWRPGSAAFSLRVAGPKRAEVSVTSLRFGRKR